jgi:hypothetical protein
MLHEMMQRVLERARQQLAGQVHRDQARLRIDVFVFRHLGLDGSLVYVHIIDQQAFDPIRTTTSFCYSFVSLHNPLTDLIVELPKVGTSFTEHLGVGIVKDTVMAPSPVGLGWFFRSLSELDHGIDGHIEVVEEHSGVPVATGKIVSVQIKSGASYFSRESDAHWSLYVEHATVNYWRNHSVPVLLLLVNVDSRTVFWTRADSQEWEKLETTFKIQVAKSQVLNGSSRDVIRELAEQTTDEDRRRAKLQTDLPIIAVAGKGVPVFLDVLNWHNKTSGRMEYWIGTSGSRPEGTRGPADLIPFASGSLAGAMGPISVAQAVAPWAAVKRDVDLEERTKSVLYDSYLAERGTFDSETGSYTDSTGLFERWLERRHGTESEGIVAYESDFETSRFRVLLEPNELGAGLMLVENYIRGANPSSTALWLL